MKHTTSLRFLQVAFASVLSLLAALPLQAQTDSAAVAEKAIYTYVEQMPVYPGGINALMQYIGSNIKYSKNQPEGKVMVSFVVDKDGTVKDVQAYESLDEALDQECVRVIQETSGKWQPGIQDGKPVAVRYVVPINFKQPKPAQTTQTTADTMPEYEAGTLALLKFVSKNIKFPKGIKARGIIEVEFIVQEDGSLSDFNIARSLEPALDAEAIRVIKLTSGNWKPGIQQGNPVKVKYKLPVVFK